MARAGVMGGLESEIGDGIRESLADIRIFAAKVHDGTITGTGGTFKNLLALRLRLYGFEKGFYFANDTISYYNREKGSNTAR